MKVLVLLTFFICGAFGTDDVPRKFTNSHGGYQFFHAEKQRLEKIFENKHLFPKKESFKTTTELDVDNDIAENVNKYDTRNKHTSEVIDIKKENKNIKATDERKRNNISINDEVNVMKESKNRRKTGNSRRRLPHRTKDINSNNSTNSSNEFLGNGVSSTRVRRIRLPKRRMEQVLSSEIQSITSDITESKTEDLKGTEENNKLKDIVEDDGNVSETAKSSDNSRKECIDCENAEMSDKNKSSRRNGNFGNISKEEVEGYTLGESKQRDNADLAKSNTRGGRFRTRNRKNTNLEVSNEDENVQRGRISRRKDVKNILNQDLNIQNTKLQSEGRNSQSAEATDKYKNYEETSTTGSINTGSEKESTSTGEEIKISEEDNSKSSENSNLQDQNFEESSNAKSHIVSSDGIIKNSHRNIHAQGVETDENNKNDRINSQNNNILFLNDVTEVDHKNNVENSNDVTKDEVNETPINLKEEINNQNRNTETEVHGNINNTEQPIIQADQTNKHIKIKEDEEKYLKGENDNIEHKESNKVLTSLENDSHHSIRYETIERKGKNESKIIFESKTRKNVNVIDNEKLVDANLKGRGNISESIEKGQKENIGTYADVNINKKDKSEEMLIFKRKSNINTFLKNSNIEETNEKETVDQQLEGTNIYKVQEQTEKSDLNLDLNYKNDEDNTSTTSTTSGNFLRRKSARGRGSTKSNLNQQKNVISQRQIHRRRQRLQTTTKPEIIDKERKDIPPNSEDIKPKESEETEIKQVHQRVSVEDVITKKEERKEEQVIKQLNERVSVKDVNNKKEEIQNDEVKLGKQYEINNATQIGSGEGGTLNNDMNNRTIENAVQVEEENNSEKYNSTVDGIGGEKKENQNDEMIEQLNVNEPESVKEMVDLSEENRVVIDKQQIIRANENASGDRNRNGNIKISRRQFRRRNNNLRNLTHSRVVAATNLTIPQGNDQKFGIRKQQSPIERDDSIKIPIITGNLETIHPLTDGGLRTNKGYTTEKLNRNSRPYPKLPIIDNEEKSNSSSVSRGRNSRHENNSKSFNPEIRSRGDNAMSNRRRYAEFVRRSWQNQNRSHRKVSLRNSENKGNGSSEGSLNSRFENALKPRNAQIKRSFAEQLKANTNESNGKNGRSEVEHLEQSLDSTGKDENNFRGKDDHDKTFRVDKNTDKENSEGKSLGDGVKDTLSPHKGGPEDALLHQDRDKIKQVSLEGLEKVNKYQTLGNSTTRKRSSDKFEDDQENISLRNHHSKNNSQDGLVVPEDISEHKRIGAIKNATVINHANETANEERKMYNPYKILEKIITTQRPNQDQFASGSLKSDNYIQKLSANTNFRIRLRRKYSENIETTSRKIADMHLQGLKNEPENNIETSNQVNRKYPVISEDNSHEFRTTSGRPIEINPHNLHLSITEENMSSKTKSLEHKTTSGRPININPHGLHLLENEDNFEKGSSKRPTRTLTVYSRDVYKLNSPFSKDMGQKKDNYKEDTHIEITKMPTRVLTVYPRTTPKISDGEDTGRKLQKPSPTEETKKDSQYSIKNSNSKGTILATTEALNNQVNSNDDEFIKSSKSQNNTNELPGNNDGSVRDKKAEHKSSDLSKKYERNDSGLENNHTTIKDNEGNPVSDSEKYQSTTKNIIPRKTNLFARRVSNGRILTVYTRSTRAPIIAKPKKPDEVKDEPQEDKDLKEVNPGSKVIKTKTAVTGTNPETNLRINNYRRIYGQHSRSQDVQELEIDDQVYSPSDVRQLSHNNENIVKNTEEVKRKTYIAQRPVNYSLNSGIRRKLYIPKFNRNILKPKSSIEDQQLKNNVTNQGSTINNSNENKVAFSSPNNSTIRENSSSESTKKAEEMYLRTKLRSQIFRSDPNKNVSKAKNSEKRVTTDTNVNMTSPNTKEQESNSKLAENESEVANVFLIKTKENVDTSHNSHHGIDNFKNILLINGDYAEESTKHVFITNDQQHSWISPNKANIKHIVVNNFQNKENTENNNNIKESRENNTQSIEKTGNNKEIGEITKQISGVVYEENQQKNNWSKVGSIEDVNNGRHQLLQNLVTTPKNNPKKQGLFTNSARSQNFILQMRRIGKDNITTTVSPLNSAKLKRELYTRRPLEKRMLMTSSTLVPYYERFFNVTRMLRSTRITTPRTAKNALFGQLKSTPRSDLPFLQKFRRHT